jgi:hypothetical protein
LVVGVLASELVNKRKEDVGNTVVVKEEAHEWDVDGPCADTRVGVGDINSDAFDIGTWGMAVNGVLELLAKVGTSRVPDRCPDGGKYRFLRWIVEGSFSSA